MSLADHERTETVLEFAMRRMGEKFRPIHIRNEKLFLTKAGDVFCPCFFRAAAPCRLRMRRP